MATYIAIGVKYIWFKFGAKWQTLSLQASKMSPAGIETATTP